MAAYRQLLMNKAANFAGLREDIVWMQSLLGILRTRGGELKPNQNQFRCCSFAIWRPWTDLAGNTAGRASGSDR